LFGTIPLANSARSARIGAHWYLRWITTVSGEGASTDAIAASRNPQPAEAAIVCSRLNFTSAEVMGVPLENLTPCRSVMVYVFWSLEVV
jgi:hypothetical protein